MITCLRSLFLLLPAKCPFGSGSMAGLESNTIGGFNSMIRDDYYVRGMTVREVELNFSAAGKVISCMRKSDCKKEEMDVILPDYLRPVKEHLEGKEG